MCEYEEEEYLDYECLINGELYKNTIFLGSKNNSILNQVEDCSILDLSYKRVYTEPFTGDFLNKVKKDLFAGSALLIENDDFSPYKVSNLEIESFLKISSILSIKTDQDIRSQINSINKDRLKEFNFNNAYKLKKIVHYTVKVNSKDLKSDYSTYDSNYY